MINFRFIERIKQCYIMRIKSSTLLFEYELFRYM